MDNWPTFTSVLYFFIVLSSYFFGYSDGTAGTVVKPSPDDKCINCIAVAISNCDKRWYCVKDVCGIFRMTEPFWEDGYSYTHEDFNKDDPNNLKSYQDCANDENCAKQITIDYLTRYATDCDGNGVIDCYDYAGMHKWGPFGGCQKNPIVNSGSYYTSLKTCLECSNQQCLSSSTGITN